MGCLSKKYGREIVPIVDRKQSDSFISLVGKIVWIQVAVVYVVGLIAADVRVGIKLPRRSTMFHGCGVGDAVQLIRIATDFAISSCGVREPHVVDVVDDMQ